MAAMVDPVLQAIVDAAVESTGAESGWLVARGDDGLEIVAASGDVMTLVGTIVSADGGTAGFVVSSGQPLATSMRGEDPNFAEDVQVLLRRSPRSVLCVPCGIAEVIGALELVDRQDGPFTFD